MNIAFCVLKGGTGKSTLATQTADAIARQNPSVLLVDCDPQGSASLWHRKRERDFDAIRLDARTLHKELPKAEADYEHIVVDTPPDKDPKIAKSAALAADIVLLPIGASEFDLAAAKYTLKCLDEVDAFLASEGREPVKRGFVLNRLRANTNLGAAMKVELAKLPCKLVGIIGERTVFATASTGLSVADSKDAKSIKELEKTLNEILKLGELAKW